MIELFGYLFDFTHKKEFDIQSFRFTDNDLMQGMTEDYARRHNTTVQQVLDIQKINEVK